MLLGRSQCEHICASDPEQGTGPAVTFMTLCGGSSPPPGTGEEPAGPTPSSSIPMPTGHCLCCPSAHWRGQGGECALWVVQPEAGGLVSVLEAELGCGEEPSPCWDGGGHGDQVSPLACDPVPLEQEGQLSGPGRLLRKHRRWGCLGEIAEGGTPQG